MRIWGTLLLVLAALTAAGESGPENWLKAAPGYRWSFPRDLAAHPDYKTEWWYLTGHLDPGDGGEAMAFQITFFRVGLTRQPPAQEKSAWATGDLVMAHAAVLDPATGHVFSEVVRRATPFLGGFGAPGDERLAWCRAPAGTDADWSLDFHEGQYRLRARDDRRGLRFDLRCGPGKPRVFHGPGGFSPKTADGTSGSLYFSETRLPVQGEVARGQEVVPVTGEAWLDREIFTDTLASGQRGWDWTALQLVDGRELMLYRLRGTKGGDDFSLGTLVERDGSTRTLSAEEWSWEPGRTWTSPRTGSEYPVDWRLRVPSAGLDLELEAIVPEQENVSEQTGIHYWEGAVRVRSAGDNGAAGRGFIELTGYGEGSRPPV